MRQRAVWKLKCSRRILRRVEQSLQLGHCLCELFRPAEELGDLDNVAAIRNRRNLQNIGDDELCGAVLGVFLQEIGEYRTGFRSVFFEETLLIFLNSIRTLAPRPQRTVESEVAQQIERVGLGLVAGFP